MKQLLRSLSIIVALCIIASIAHANTQAQKLKHLALGVDSAVIKSVVGEPTLRQDVKRYYYGADEVIVVDSSIYDIRLAHKDNRVQIKLIREKSRHKDLQEISFLRIGMNLDEAYYRAGEPDSIVSGTDWYYTKRHRVELVQGKARTVETHIKMSLEILDWVWLNFSNGGLLLMNIAIALVMFGVALQIKLSQFKQLLQHPKPVVVGALSQFVGVPLVTFLFIMLIHPTPSIAMGMILVAACPGGNVSNFISSMAKGNVALSVSLTAVSTLVAIFMTPLNFSLWGKLYSETSSLVVPIAIDPVEMLKTVLMLLGIPIALGIGFAHKFPKLTERVLKPIKIFSMVFFFGFVVAALANNFDYFLRFIHLIMLIVIGHNALCLISGYLVAKGFKLPQRDCRTISIETGIQNSGLGLVLIFNPNLFDGLGGMAFVAATWGIWHIVSGLILASFWSRKPVVE